VFLCQKRLRLSLQVDERNPRAPSPSVSSPLQPGDDPRLYLSPLNQPTEH